MPPRSGIPESNLSEGIVGWEGQDDPEMPLNFPSSKKWLIITFLAIITFFTPFASSSLAPAISYLSHDFGNADSTKASFPVSIYLLGYSVGPLFLAGLSEIYGRHMVLSASNIFFCVWQVGCALAPSLDSLIAFRFLAGTGGGACMTLGGGIIADLFPVEQRGLALTAWMVGPLIGPSIGPLIGAFIAQTIGWRWNFWVVLIPAAIATAVIAILGTETNHRVLIGRKVKRLRKELGRNDLCSCYESQDNNISASRVMVNGLIRPLKILLLSPLMTSMSLYISFAYGVLYLLFNTIPTVFGEGYGWSTGLTGLVYIPLGLGYMVGMIWFAKMSDKTVMRLTKNNGGVYEPEMRLIDCIWFSFLLPVTFFWYGWTTYYHIHWIVPIIGLFPFGLAIFCVWQPFQAYIIDAYGHYAASALAAFSVLRSIVAAFLPLGGPKLYANLGLGWGNSLLGFICVALIPAPLLVYKYGAYLRERFPVKL
ncbi:MFS general substrate transporter [Thozetella sp. PMI_491]|nr:MFS general substrate transporter [Thozetella sp. PMI_491]